jgi:hypothetical protein
VAQLGVVVDDEERQPYLAQDAGAAGMLHLVVRSGDLPADLEGRPPLDDLGVEVGAPLGGILVLLQVVVVDLPARLEAVLAAEDVPVPIWAEGGARVTQKTNSEIWGRSPLNRRNHRNTHTEQ